jgi:hypothetical protein
VLLLPAQPAPPGCWLQPAGNPETVICAVQVAVLPLMSVTVTVTGTICPTCVRRDGVGRKTDALHAAVVGGLGQIIGVERDAFLAVEVQGLVEALYRRRRVVHFRNREGAVLVSPFTSVTVKVTVMLPAPETVVPAAGDCVTPCTPQLSPVVQPNLCSWAVSPCKNFPIPKSAWPDK